MTNIERGSFRLVSFAGIDLFLHWSWFLVAVYEINNRARDYSSPGWNVLEYLALFLIVTLHEYGHALACRQVGGKADRIVLWPLGGLAYVQPPQRPGATLWSTAAGPLVNVALIPILLALIQLNRISGWAQSMPNAHALLRAVWAMNIILLVFNILPVYPLDGGQILRSLLWFVVGRARSLMAATVIGFTGVLGLTFYALRMQSVWLGALAAFMFFYCWQGFRQARALSQVEALPRRDGFACPACKKAPRKGLLWACTKCRTRFDTFQTQAVCPHCGARFAVTRCLDCHRTYAMSEWVIPAPAGGPSMGHAS